MVNAAERKVSQHTLIVCRQEASLKILDPERHHARCPVNECGRKHHQLLHTSDKLNACEEDVQILLGFASVNSKIDLWRQGMSCSPPTG